MKHISNVNKLFLSFAALLTILFLGVAGFAQTNGDNIKEGDLPKRLATPAEVSKLSEWQRYKFSAAGFSMLFPDLPGQTQTPKPTPKEYAKQSFYFWDTSDEQLFLGTIIIEIAPNLSTNLENSAENYRQIQKNRNATLLSEKKTETNGISAIDFYYQVPDEPTPVLSYARIINCGKRIYTLLGSGTKYQSDLAEVSKKFFDSFSPTEKCEITSTTNAVDSEDEAAENSAKTSRGKTNSTKSTPEPKTTRSESASRRYIRGPRGGCYYISGSGSKVYVSRSLCN